MNATYVIQLPFDKPTLTLNQRLHYREVAKRSKALRAIAAESAAHVPRMLRCRVELYWFVTDRRRRDEDNPVPTLKALCDGIVDAGVVPDDTPEYMKKMMPEIILLGKGEGPARMELRIVKLK